MRITDLLKPDTLILNLQAKSKEAALDELVDKLAQAGRLNDANSFKESVLQRESHTTTGLGEGIAIPHAKTDAVKEPAIAFGRSEEGVDYGALDEQPVHLLFMIAAPENAKNLHVETLARLFTLLNEETRRAIRNIHSAEQFFALIERRENEVLAEQTVEEQAQQPPSSVQTSTSYAESSGSSAPYVVCVTACPTGIAHTYMAADALKQKAKEKGIEIKVETDGSAGVKNELTKEDITRATAVIVAADKNIAMERFAGKHVIQVPVGDGIRKTDELLNRAIKQTAPIYQASGKEQKEEVSSAPRKHGIYKHLMNGVSNMLPFVVGGGILTALSFLIGGINAEGELAQLFNLIGQTAFSFLVPILAAYIASSIGDRPAFLPGMVAGFLTAQAGAGFLGGLVAGFLAGYVVLFLKWLLKDLPQILEGLKPVLLFPVLGLLLTGGIMQLAVNPPVAQLNMAMTGWLNSLSGGNAIVLGILLGGMMAVDLGGPINKVAFTFGIAAIQSGNFGPHAAVMAGGMVPPLAIAFATTCFKHKFTPAELKSGISNYVMGLSFITEGAIPFAAADPLRVIVSGIVGSAIAGGLSMTFGITLPASHGGIFVIALVNKPLLYLMSIFIGAVISGTILGVWKKKVTH